jgi:hypothetical protein
MSLTIQDLEKIITSLTYSKKAVEETTSHPTPEFKTERLNELDDLLKKVREMKDGSAK